MGFEPTVGLNPRRCSRPFHSSALAPFRFGGLLGTYQMNQHRPLSVHRMNRVETTNASGFLTTSFVFPTLITLQKLLLTMAQSCQIFALRQPQEKHLLKSFFDSTMAVKEATHKRYFESFIRLGLFCLYKVSEGSKSERTSSIWFIHAIKNQKTSIGITKKVKISFNK